MHGSGAHCVDIEGIGLLGKSERGIIAVCAAENPTSSRVIVEMRTDPRRILDDHSAASGLEASRTSADLSISHAVMTTSHVSRQDRRDRRRFR